MTSQFVVGQSYRNREGRYEVISVNGNAMMIRYADGQTVERNIQTQARIWERIQEEVGFGADDFEVNSEEYSGTSKDTQEVRRLVIEVLNTMSPPWSSDITDQVCLQIEHDPKWLAYYQKLVKEIGKANVNTSLGLFVKQQTGLETSGTGKATSRLIKTYSLLVPR